MMTEQQFEQLPEVKERAAQFQAGLISLREFVDTISLMAFELKVDVPDER